MSKRVINSDWASKQLASVKSAAPEVDADRAMVAPYLKAAATLDVFTPELVSIDGKSGDALHLLREHARPANLPDERLVWRLTDDQRAMALRSLSRDDMLSVIKQNPDRVMTATQTMLERFLDNEVIDVNTSTMAEVAAIQRVAARCRSLLPNIPSDEALQERIDLLRLSYPFVELTKTGFHGRQNTVDAVREYLGVSQERSTFSRFSAWVVEDVFSFQEKPPLMIYGTGGIGKSTLLSKTILEHCFNDPADRIPYIYLNFESPDLSIEEPLTIVLEAASQIGAQYSEAKADAFALMEHAFNVMSHTEYGGGLESATGRAHQDMREECVAHFRKFLENWSPKDRPLLFACDTFERVQISATSWPTKFWAFLDELQQSLPRLRVIVAGRRPVAGVPSENIELNEMDRSSAVQFLSELLEDVPDVTEDDLEDIAATVGGNPLSLKLASSALMRIGIREALGGIQKRHWYLLPIRDSQIQGQLYRRILDHIEDPDVRQLAHPGLVLRRITPQVIQQVLAAACEIAVPSIEEADDLCSRLESYADLVTRDVDGSLRHREDVRRIMLPTLTAEQPDKVERIHESAVAYYRKRYEETNAPVHRVEELYHRLVLGDDNAVLEDLWIDEARESLADYEEEFSLSSRVFLRSMLRLPIEDDMLENAATETWEREAVRRAEELQARKEFKKALKVLRERDLRSGQPRIVRLEAELLERVGRGEDAGAVFRNGIDAAIDNDKLGHYIELSTAYIRILEDKGQLDEAQFQIRRLREIAEQSISDDTRLHLELQEIRIQRKQEEKPSTPGREQQAADLYLALNLDVLESNRALSTEAAAELGNLPGVMARALTTSPPLPLAKDSKAIDEIASAFLKDEQVAALLGKTADGSAAEVIEPFVNPAHQQFRVRLAHQLRESRLDKGAMDALVRLYQLSLM